MVVLSQFQQERSVTKVFFLYSICKRAEEKPKQNAPTSGSIYESNDNNDEHDQEIVKSEQDSEPERRGTNRIQISRRII